MKTTLAALVAVLALTLSGCSTINSRINERASVFYALDPATQDQIRHGQVGIGYTPDMVYMALGRPTRSIVQQTSDRTAFTWIYKSFYEEYAGSAFAGYHRYAVPDRAPGRYVIVTEPVYTDIYRERAEEYIRLTFRDGKVTAIDQTNNA
jgi:hypothetical protein